MRIEELGRAQERKRGSPSWLSTSLARTALRVTTVARCCPAAQSRKYPH